MAIIAYNKKPGSKIWKAIPELDPAHVERVVQPLQKGRADGNDNQPPAGSTRPAEAEQQIIFEAEKYLKTVDDLANKEFTDIIRMAEPLSLVGIEDDFSDLLQGVQNEFNNAKIRTLPELKQFRIEERRQLRDLKLFKEQNKLDRLAKYPSSKVWHLALVASCLAAESFANMYYFAGESDLYMLGGFMQALGISAANIVSAFIAGLLAMRYIHHVNRIKRFMAAAALGSWMALSLLYHLLMAHYRDMLIIDPDGAMLGAWDKLRAAPFGLESMESYVILIIGVVISIAALVDGYKFDDSYPRYGAADRDYKKKLEAFNNAERKLRETLLKSVAKAGEQIQERLKKYQKQADEITDLYTGAASVVEHFDNIYRQVDEIVNSAVTTYREANLRVRTDPAPASFDAMPVVGRLIKKDRFMQRLNELKQLKESTTAKLAQLRRRSTAMLNKLTEETDNMAMKIDSLNREIDRSASDQIKQDQEVRI